MYNLNGRKMTIVGVMQDFHYGKVENLIGPVAFTFWTPGDRTSNLIYLLSRGFLFLLSISAFIALPATYFIMIGAQALKAVGSNPGGGAEE